MDETTPHLHYDIIPFAEGYQRGMSRQQSISKALEQMGYGTGENAILNFTESERQVFQQICENHGFEVAEPEKGRGQTIETQQYGNIQDAKRAAEKELEQERQEHEENLKQIAVKANEQEVRRILEQEKAAKVQAEREAAESEVENLNAELERKRAAAKNYLDAIEIPPFNPKPYPPKPKLPEKYQTEPVDAYPNYSSNQNQIEDEAGKGWEYCNLQIAENEITGKLSFSVRLATQNNSSVYAAEIDFYEKSYADGSEFPVLRFDGNLEEIENHLDDNCFLCAHAQQLEIPQEEESEE